MIATPARSTGETREPPAALLRLSGVHKAYAAPVLRGVDFDLRAGEVHALVGANGAGKTTLARIVAGIIPSDRGEITLDGAPYRPTTKPIAEQRGVQIVQQELNLIGTLTVAENLFLGDIRSRLGLIDYAGLRDRARQALAPVGLDDHDPDTPVELLGVGKQQLVAIAAALARTCRVLILDEPTAALTDPQIDRLFAEIERRRRDGVGVVYVSHRLEELRRIADRATVLRDGRAVATDALERLPLERLVELMVGAEAAETGGGDRGEREGANRAAGDPDPVLEVEELTRGPLVRAVSFEVRRGEIFGLGGLVGSGRTELLRAIYGADRAESGGVRVGRGPRRRFSTPRQATRAGIAMIPEDRKRDGLLLPRSLRLNVTVGTLAELSRLGWIAPAREYEAARDTRDRLRVECRDVDQSVAELSGGNQQKVLIGRWLLLDAEVFLFDEPTRGIDVGARAAVHRLLERLAANGKGVVVVTSDLDELMALSDRIGVLSAGRLVEVFERGRWSREAILAAAFSEHLERRGAAG